jgi:hypothetical protein
LVVSYLLDVSKRPSESPFFSEFTSFLPNNPPWIFNKKERPNYYDSPYTILLDIEEKKRLEAITRKYTSPYCDVMRAKVVLLATQGMSNKEIGERLDLPRQIVSKWRKRFFD